MRLRKSYNQGHKGFMLTIYVVLMGIRDLRGMPMTFSASKL